MTGTLRVTPEKLVSAADVFSSSAGHLKRTTDEMQSMVHSLDHYWKSEASLMYIRKFNSLGKSMMLLYRMIDEHSRDLKQMALNYNKAEDSNISTFSILNASVLSEPGASGNVGNSGQGNGTNEKTTASAFAEWMGYEVDQNHPGVTAWAGKAGAEANGDWGNAEVNAYLGKAEAEAEFKAGLMQSTTKSEYKNGEWTEKESLSVLYAEAGVGAGVSILAADGQFNTGSDMLGFGAKGEVSAGNAKIEGKGTFSIGEDGINANLKGEAMVSAAKGEASASFNILGLEIKGKVGGYAGAFGAEGKIGIEDNKFVMEGGVAATLGLSAGIEIGFNDSGWDNFVDFITFWD